MVRPLPPNEDNITAYRVALVSIQEKYPDYTLQRMELIEVTNSYYLFSYDMKVIDYRKALLPSVYPVELSRKIKVNIEKLF